MTRPLAPLYLETARKRKDKNISDSIIRLSEKIYQAFGERKLWPEEKSKRK